jgi:hypothetical protein
MALGNGRFLGGVGGDMREVEDHKMQEGAVNGLMDFWIFGLLDRQAGERLFILNS